MKYTFAAMLIEFVGCSGAGKTTLSQSVAKSLSARGLEVVSSRVLIARTTCTAWVKNPSLRNVLLNFLLLPWFVRSLLRHIRYYPFALRIIHRKSNSLFDRISRSRSLMRLMASDELLRRKKKKEQIILVDEGPLGCVHNLFVHVHSDFREHEIRRFLRLVPLPDLIVYVDAPVELAVERTLKRPDPPLWRESRENLVRFVRQGIKAYKAMFSHLQMNCRALSVVNDDETSSKLDDMVDQIVQFIISRGDES